MKYSMWKKMISALLAVIMVIGMIPAASLPALAADKISVTSVSVTVNEDRLPKAGDPVIAYTDFLSASKGSVYVLAGFHAWYDDLHNGKDHPNHDGATWNYINTTDQDHGYRFEAGRTYYYTMTFKIRDAFTATHAFPTGENKVDFTIRNLSGSQYSVYMTKGYSGIEMSAVIKFTIPGERTYDDIDVAHCYRYTSGYASNASDLPPTRDKYPQSFHVRYANYTVESAWEGEFDPEKKCFVAGNTYRLVITFTARDGYKFAEDCRFMFTHYMGYYVDEKLKAEPDSITFKDGRKKMVVEFEFLVEDFKPISVVTLDNRLIDQGKDPMDLLPYSGAYLTPPGDALQITNPLYQFTYTADFYEKRTWHDDGDEQINYAPYEGLCHFTIGLSVTDPDYYRFDNDVNFFIEGIPSEYYWTEYELSEDNKVVHVTFNFVSSYHRSEAQTGKTLERRMKCTSYKGLKFALENPNIQYAELVNVHDTLPLQTYTSADQVLYIKRDVAIKVQGQKHLTITGDNSLTVEQVDPTAYFPYQDLIYIPMGAGLTVTGSGSLTAEFGQPNYPAAMFFNKGTLDVSGVTLFADALYRDVYPQVINNSSQGKLTVTGGSFKSRSTFPLENAAVMLSFGSDTYIDGGVFDATNGNGGTGNNYGLMLLTDELSLEINRGTFKSCGGIRLSNSTANLGDYVNVFTHVCNSGGYARKDPSDINNAFLEKNGGQTQVMEAVMDLYVNAAIPVQGKTPRDTITVDSPKYSLRTEPVWYRDGVRMNLDDPFALGSSYSVKFELRTNSTDGYKLQRDMDLVNVYLNGQKATATESTYYQDTLVVEYDFGACRETVVDVGVSGLTEPDENDTPDFSASYDDSAVGRVVTNGVKWYRYSRTDPDAQWEEMTKEDRFVSNDYSYRVEILVMVLGTKTLNTNAGGQLSVNTTLNGQGCGVAPYYNQDGTLSTKYVYLTQQWGFVWDTEIEELDLQIRTPAVGEQPTYVLESGHSQFEQRYGDGGYDVEGNYNDIMIYHYYSHNGITWYDDTTGKVMYDHDTFILGHEYTVYITLYANSAFTFFCDRYDGSQCTATVNGQEAQIGWASNSLVHEVSATFLCEGEAAACSVSGTVTSFGSTGDPVKLTLSSGSNTYETTVSGNAADYYIANVAAGTYTMTVSKANHVTRTYTVTVGGSSVIQDVKIHLRGDIDGNGKVNVGDTTKVYSHVKKTALITDEYMLLCADVSGDGRINVGDTTKVYAHVKKTSPLW